MERDAVAADADAEEGKQGSTFLRSADITTGSEFQVPHFFY